MFVPSGDEIQVYQTERCSRHRQDRGRTRTANRPAPITKYLDLFISDLGTTIGERVFLLSCSGSLGALVANAPLSDQGQASLFLIGATGATPTTTLTAGQSWPGVKPGCIHNTQDGAHNLQPSLIYLVTIFHINTVTYPCPKNSICTFFVILWMQSGLVMGFGQWEQNIIKILHFTHSIQYRVTIWETHEWREVFLKDQHKACMKY